MLVDTEAEDIIIHGDTDMLGPLNSNRWPWWTNHPDERVSAHFLDCDIFPQKSTWSALPYSSNISGLDTCFGECS